MRAKELEDVLTLVDALPQDYLAYAPHNRLQRRTEINSARLQILATLAGSEF